ncbi:MAG: secretin and TonB N-terminal domain-containing protein, partial [Desulfobacterales bacterium]|nr:secretin and TonB N-terminal domain-containing protein [Desulfobacterales bacterium]
MFYKIMKFSKIRALSILLIILLMLFAGCASSKAVKQADQEATESLNLITDISMAEGSESLAILIKGKRLLTYTSVKQPMPLGIALYFPETALGEIKTALTLDSDTVASIKASELTENGHTSKVEIALRQDAPYEVFREGNGLQISFAKAGKTTASAQDPSSIKPAEANMPAETAVEEDKDKKPAWVNRVDFSSEDAGKSTIIIGTTRPVKYKMDKAADKRLQLTLFNTNLPDYRKRPLITTRFNSAVDLITPTQTSDLKTGSMILIELRESVPYYIEQADDLLLVHFDASSIPPRPVERADLPSWKKVMVQTAAEPMLREAQEPVKRTGPVSAPRKGVVTETPLDAADYDIDAQRRIDTYTGKETELDIFRSSKTKKMYKGEKISLDFYDTDIKNVFLILREVSGKNFAIDKDVAGKVTLTLAKPVPWDQALDLILKMNQLGKIYEGNIIRIATLGTLEAEEKQLKEKLKEKQDAVRQEDHITAFIPVNYGSASEMNTKHILPILTADPARGPDQQGKSTVEERLNMIVIRDVPLVVKQAREIIQKLDKVTPQVMIEARIVEASDKFSREIGVDWNTGTNAAGGAVSTSSALGGKYGYNAAVNFPFSLLSATNAATMGFSFARTAGNSRFVLDAAILAYETQGDLKIVSSPKIITLDNKKATIKQGIKYPYLKYDESGNTTTEFEDIDLVLEVTPHVTS